MTVPTAPSGASAPLVFVGAATYDAIALVARMPAPDERVVADDVVFAGGGPAATAAVTAARLGLPAAFVGVVGDDDAGERILDGLRQERVDVHAVQVATGARSQTSVVVADGGRGSRAICTRPAPPLIVPPGSAAAALIGTAGWLHVDHLGWGPITALLGRRTPDAGAEGEPRLSVDAGNPIAGFDPRGVDLYVPTIDFLRRAHGDLPAADLLDAALAAGARAVVATRGSEGSVGATAAGERYQVPATPVDVVSTLGAGDVFHGALVAAVAGGMALADASRLAGTVAALSCRGVDGRSAVPDLPTALAHTPAHAPAQTVDHLKGIS